MTPNTTSNPPAYPGPGRPKLSAVIACYKDGPAVRPMYDRLTATFARIGCDHEIIFVNDASPDDAGATLADLAAGDSRVVVITHTRNFGSQSAFSSGLAVATGDAVVLLDGDLQDPPEVIEAFYAKWREGYEVVYGERVKREAPLLLRAGYRLFYRLFRALAYVPVPLDACDFSLLDRCVVNALNSLPENNRFLRGLRAWVGFRQAGVPYVRPERPFGRSTNSWLKNFGWARKAICSFSYVPLDAISVIACVTVCLSVLAAAAQAVARLVAPDLVPAGLTTVIVLILLMSGLQFFCLAIIGSYLAHVYDEVKRRPAYIVRNILNDPREQAAANERRAA
jgi:dolichol-phosphate mannosyltransferase